MHPLAVIGNVNVDLIMGLDATWPQMGTEVIVGHDELRVGGSAGNCALAWAAMGVEHQIAATVGDDQFGRWLQDAFGRRSQDWPTHDGATTISVGITHPGNERTFLTTLGHLPHMALNHVMAALDGEALKGGIALLCGSFLTDRFTAEYPAFFAWARANNVRVGLDTGWPVAGWTEENRTACLSWLASTDIALFNETETVSLAGIEDVGAAAIKLRATMPNNSIFVAKLGAAGAIAATGGDTLIAVPAPKVAVIDTIGAGDVFNAGFLWALAEGLPIRACLERGTEIASRAISTQPRRYDDLADLPQTEPAR